MDSPNQLAGAASCKMVVATLRPLLIVVQDKGILYDHLYLISLPAFDIQLKSLNINVAAAVLKSMGQAQPGPGLWVLA